MLSVIMLNVAKKPFMLIILNVIMLNVVALSVVAPSLSEATSLSWRVLMTIVLPQRKYLAGFHLRHVLPSCVLLTDADAFPS